MSTFFLGLDWSSSQLKVACFKLEKGNSYNLFSVSRLNINPERPKEAVETLTKWVKSNLGDVSQTDAVLSLPESSIFLKEIELPKVKDKELSEAGFWEVSSVAPIKPSEAIFAWKKISEAENSTIVSAMVVKSETVEAFLSIFEKTGIRVLAVEPSSLSFSRVSKTTFEKTSLLLIVEEEETNLIVLKKGVPVFSTSVPIPLTRSNDKRRKLGKNVIEDVTSAAKTAISFWEAKEKDEIKQIVTAGEGVKYYGLSSKINSFAHVPTTSAKIKLPANLSKGAQPELTVKRFLVAIGAAARLFSEDLFSEVNLYPKKKKEILEKEKHQRLTLRRISLFTKINAYLLSLALVFSIASMFWGRALDKKIKETSRFVDNHPAQALKEEVETTNKLLVDIEKLLLSQKDTGARLREVIELTPAGVGFTAVDFSYLEKEEWTIKGVGSRENILAFYEKLKTDSGGEVFMPYSNLENARENDFEITIKW